MFVIEGQNENGRWFQVWSSADGADTASYLATIIRNRPTHADRYRMRYVLTAEEKAVAEIRGIVA